MIVLRLLWKNWSWKYSNWEVAYYKIYMHFYDAYWDALVNSWELNCILIRLGDQIISDLMLKINLIIYY